MGVKERKEKEKQQRINLILKAAEKVFTIKGLENATVNDVAELAELGKGTLYLYFANKDDILFALTSQYISELHRVFETAVLQHKKGTDKLRAIGYSYIDFCKKYPLRYQLINHYSKVKPIAPDTEKSMPHFTRCQEESQKLFGLMIAVIQQGVKDKTISKKIDPFQAALVMWGTTTGIYQMIHTMSDHFEQEHQITSTTLTELYFDMMEQSLKNFKS